MTDLKALADTLKAQVDLRDIVALLWGQPERNRARCHAVVEVGNICYTQYLRKSLSYVEKKSSAAYETTAKRKAKERRRQASALPPKLKHVVYPPHTVK